MLLRRKIEKSLKRRGRKTTINGNMVKGPDRMFDTITEELIWALNESGEPLSIEELSNYLDFNRKSVSKALQKLFNHELTSTFITKEKEGSFLRFNAKLPKDSHVPTVFKIIQCT